MGLGKTIQTIALFASLAAEKGIWGPHLVIVPTSLVVNWEIEFKKWCPAFKILTYFGDGKVRTNKRKGWMAKDAFNVCIVGYQTLRTDVSFFKKRAWYYMVLDEAHNIKNFKSKQWEALLTFQTMQRLLLTGTPLQNDLIELWSLMHFLMPQIFSDVEDFKLWFSDPLTTAIEKARVAGQAALVSRLHALLRPFMLRRLKSEVEKQLPSKVEHTIACPLSKRQRQLYDEFINAKEQREKIEHSQYLGMLNVLMQLRKVCNHPALFKAREVGNPFVIRENLRFPVLIHAGLILSQPGACKLFGKGPAGVISGLRDGSGLSRLLLMGLLFAHRGMTETKREARTRRQILLAARCGGVDKHAKAKESREAGYPRPLLSFPLRRKEPEEGPGLPARQSSVGNTYDKLYSAFAVCLEEATAVLNEEEAAESAGGVPPQQVQWGGGGAEVLPAGGGKKGKRGVPTDVAETGGGKKARFGRAATEEEEMPNGNVHLHHLENGGMGERGHRGMMNDVPPGAAFNPNGVSLNGTGDHPPQVAAAAASAFHGAHAAAAASSSSSSPGPQSSGLLGLLDMRELLSTALRMRTAKRTEAWLSSQYAAEGRGLHPLKRLSERSQHWLDKKAGKMAKGKRKARKETLEMLGAADTAFLSLGGAMDPVYGLDLREWVQRETRSDPLMLRSRSRADICSFTARSAQAIQSLETHPCPNPFWQHPFRTPTKVLKQLCPTPDVAAKEAIEEKSRWVAQTPNAFAYPPELRLWGRGAVRTRMWMEGRGEWLNFDASIEMSRDVKASPGFWKFSPTGEMIREGSGVNSDLEIMRKVVFPDKGVLLRDCGKFVVLKDLLLRLRREGHKVLLFTQMAKVLDTLEPFINYLNFKYVRLDGGMKPDERMRVVTNFNNNDKIFMFISSTRAGGIGLNLTAADTVIFYDTDWNPAMDRQAMDRAHRIGQTRDVHVYRLICHKTVEENVFSKQLQKRQLDDVVVDKGSFNFAASRGNEPMMDSAALHAVLSTLEDTRELYKDRILHEQQTEEEAAAAAAAASTAPSPDSGADGAAAAAAASAADPAEKVTLSFGELAALAPRKALAKRKQAEQDRAQALKNIKSSGEPGNIEEYEAALAEVEREGGEDDGSAGMRLTALEKDEEEREFAETDEREGGGGEKEKENEEKQLDVSGAATEHVQLDEYTQLLVSKIVARCIKFYKQVDPNGVVKQYKKTAYADLGSDALKNAVSDSDGSSLEGRGGKGKSKTSRRGGGKRVASDVSDHEGSDEESESGADEEEEGEDEDMGVQSGSE
uniref:Uncharacterized protein n=1 Tax=Chromera velia CCMP2878 TaxID=1169474 RepID=A0A0G4HPX4_9ALVE|eukprot:Cvel_1232.t1-p1 / transcript=Cvel_1232.t1 / gene=Cvel_1232 / organism=Chromera_velia_CCMP2878 / gene_product=Helicase ssl-1, putative / transcript_product=Helicase ssl-1, putative / location=Cvel_scaffold41:53802-59819(+) / protein_length=1286 / sequence_SO=supercontig / SO=protein_coding / is_pseudo=false